MKTLENKQAAGPPRPPAPVKVERRYDVDWLRVIAVFSVIALHTSVIFSFGMFNVKHTQHTLAVDTIGDYLNVWIIPLLFVLAGAATKFSRSSPTSLAGTSCYSSQETPVSPSRSSEPVISGS